MKQIRIGVFETNSSSTHSITIVSKENYNRWKNGEMLFDQDSESIVKIPEDYNEETQDDKYDYLKTYDDWVNGSEMEDYFAEFKTEHDDEIVVFGRYGYDG